jgi:glycosyltransferase involved in cell wall biosynthesis
MTEPLVSICVPVYNGADVLTRALESALAQDYPNIELVVSDDGSTDGTVDLVREVCGDRVSLHLGPGRTGAGANWTRSVALSNGELIKFLHHDDSLRPDCISRMVEPFVEHASVGMVFCPRTVDSPTLAPEDYAQYRDPHRHFRDLKRFNHGPDLFEQILAFDFRENWFGEPSNVMARRSSMEAVGGFHRYARQLLDMDMWLRLSGSFDVGFIDERLTTYGVSQGNLTDRNRSARLDEMDRVWLLESLCAEPRLARWHDELNAKRRHERSIAARTTGQAAIHGRWRDATFPLYRQYIGHRVRARLGEAKPLHQPVFAGASDR